MNEEEIVKIGMEVALRPVTDIAENALGVLGGDWLPEVRLRNRARLKANTEEILNKRGVKSEEIPSPSVAIPLLSAAQDESNSELQAMWAKLLAATLDPKRMGAFRKEFVEIAAQFEPIDVLVLPILARYGSLEPSRLEFISNHLGIPQDHVANSFAFLLRVGLTDEKPGVTNPKVFPHPTAKGRQFLAAIAD